MSPPVAALLTPPRMRRVSLFLLLQLQARQHSSSFARGGRLLANLMLDAVDTRPAFSQGSCDGPRDNAELRGAVPSPHPSPRRKRRRRQGSSPPTPPPSPARGLTHRLPAPSARSPTPPSDPRAAYAAPPANPAAAHARLAHFRRRSSLPASYLRSSKRIRLCHLFCTTTQSPYRVKWGPEPLGPVTVCDRRRKKMKRIECRRTLEQQGLQQATAAPPAVDCIVPLGGRALCGYADRVIPRARAGKLAALVARGVACVVTGAEHGLESDVVRISAPGGPGRIKAGAVKWLCTPSSSRTSASMFSRAHPASALDVQILSAVLNSDSDSGAVPSGLANARLETRVDAGRPLV
ncbi:hypothetical protein B0H15DRAFT_954553 [Mycena belliarum]|uniref:Uncharacterized protein n=1 Tax=Mycena belliarum TaxID=1033014 RepID=A0AAD6TX47_9AGAR|nr:hypothetical protein B0H15DRAFT_954553 [Mycena belliae]